MTENTKKLAQQTFQAALGAGPSEQPKSLKLFFAQAVRVNGQPSLSNKESLENSLDAEFPFLRPLVWADSVPDGASSVRWEIAVRGVLDSLRSWNMENANALFELQALLIATQVLDVRSAGLESVAASLVGDGLKTGLLRLVENANVGIHNSHRGNPAEIQNTLKLAGHQVNYENLTHLLRNLMPEPQTDLSAAIVLLWVLEPDKLADAVTEKDNILFSLLVCLVLEDSSALFALKVPLIAFKFISIRFLQQAHNASRMTHDWSDVYRRLLLQVAQTSDWAGWMNALFKYLNNDSLAAEALSKALVDLDEKHWNEFLGVLSLSHSQLMAAPVASIMLHFSNEVIPSKAKAMWSIAFKKWSVWNYAEGEEQAHLFAPTACALDFPVAMYYSQQQASTLNEEEYRLTQAVEEIEQLWFESFSDLVTERNRLLSRLRLVQHGRELAAGSSQGLPPPILPEDDLYTRVRYS